MQDIKMRYMKLLKEQKDILFEINLHYTNGLNEWMQIYMNGLYSKLERYFEKSNDIFKLLAEDNTPIGIYEYELDIYKFGYCPNCKGDIDSSMNFCKYCGTELNWNIEEHATVNTNEKIQCVPNCIDCEHYKLCDYNRDNPTVLPFS